MTLSDKIIPTNASLLSIQLNTMEILSLSLATFLELNCFPKFRRG